MANFLALAPSKSKGDKKVSPKISSGDKLVSINLKVIEANKILKGTLAFEKKALGNKIKQSEKSERKKEETELETPPDNKETKSARGLGIKLPKSKFLDGVKNFVMTTLIGFAAVRLLKFLPQITKILKPLGTIAKFLINVGGLILKGLIAFLDAGVKAFEFTRNAVKKTFGEDGVKKFDSFVGNLSKFLNLVMTVGMTAVAVSMAMADQDSGRDRTPDGKPPRRKPRSLGDRLRRTRRSVQTKVGRKLKQAKNFAKNFTPKNLMQRGKNLFGRFKDMGKGLLTKIDDAAKSFMGSLDNIIGGIKNFGANVGKKIGNVAKMAMDAPGKLRKMVQNALKGKIDGILKQNDLIKKLSKLNPKDAPKNIKKLLEGAKRNKNILKLRQGLKAAKAAKIGGVDAVIAAVLGLIDYTLFKESPINAILRAVGGLLGYTAGFAIGAPFGGVPGFITGMAGAFVGEKASMLLAKGLSKTKLGGIKDPIMNDGRMLVRDPDGEDLTDEVKEGNESLTPINLGDSKNLDTSILETNASYESGGGEVALVNNSSDGGGADTSEEGGNVVNMSNNGDDDNRDTSSDLFYKNSG